MRNSGITTHVVRTPWRNLTYVLVHTDEGLTGVGETRMLGRADALLGHLREAEDSRMAGSGPFAVEDPVRRLTFGGDSRAGEIVMSGIAVVEIACWDIKGKALGVPVRQLPGGRVTDRGKAYANGRYATKRTPDAHHKAAEAVIERGHRALKIDPFETGHDKVGMPMADGEGIHARIEFRELFESGAADIIQPDLGHMAGILGTRKPAATAETHYTLITPHNTGGSASTDDNLQLATCTTNFKTPIPTGEARVRGPAATTPWPAVSRAPLARPHSDPCPHGPVHRGPRRLRRLCADA